MEQNLREIQALGLKGLTNEEQKEFNTLLGLVEAELGVSLSTKTTNDDPSTDVVPSEESTPSAEVLDLEASEAPEAKDHSEKKKEHRSTEKAESKSRSKRSASGGSRSIQTPATTKTGNSSKHSSSKRSTVKDDVKSRIGAPARGKVNLNDPSIADTYMKIRDDNDDTCWMLLGYGDSQTDLKVYNSGSGSWDDFVNSVVEEPVYGYIRYVFGDTSRFKFIFVTYVPDSLNGMKKARINGHKPDVSAMLKYFHIEINALSLEDLTVKNLEAKLKAAGGADYGIGTGGGSRGEQNFSGIKNKAAGFLAKKDAESDVKIVFEKGPLSTTPMDLSGRPMVASASEAQKNTVLLGNSKQHN